MRGDYTEVNSQRKEIHSWFELLGNLNSQGFPIASNCGPAPHERLFPGEHGILISLRQGLHTGLQAAFDLNVGSPVSEPCCCSDPRNTVLGSSLSQNNCPPLL